MNIDKDYINKINALALIFISIYCIASVGYEMDSSHKLIYVLTRLVTNLAFPLMLMGLGAVMLKKHKNPFECVKKTYMTLIPPFILWNIILAVLIIHYNGFHSFATTITNVNWFIWIVLSNVLVIPILSESIHYVDDAIKYILAMFVIASIALSLSVQFNFSLYFIDLVFFAEPFVFMVLGYYLDNREFKFDSSKLFIICLIILLITLSVRGLLVAKGIASWNAYFTQVFGTTLQISIDPFTIIEVSSLFLMIKSLNGFLSNNSVINFYSKKAFSIILASGVFTFILSKFTSAMGWINLTVISAIPFLIVIGIIFFILEKIPVINKIF